MYAFGRRFYPKWPTLHSIYTHLRLLRTRGANSTMFHYTLHTFVTGYFCQPISVRFITNYRIKQCQTALTGKLSWIATQSYHGQLTKFAQQYCTAFLVSLRLCTLFSLIKIQNGYVFIVQLLLCWVWAGRTLRQGLEWIRNSARLRRCRALQEPWCLCCWRSGWRRQVEIVCRQTVATCSQWRPWLLCSRSSPYCSYWEDLPHRETNRTFWYIHLKCYIATQTTHKYHINPVSSVPCRTPGSGIHTWQISNTTSWKTFPMGCWRWQDTRRKLTERGDQKVQMCYQYVLVYFN